MVLMGGKLKLTYLEAKNKQFAFLLEKTTDT